MQPSRDQLEIAELKRKLAGLVRAGCLDNSFVECIDAGGSPAPIECELLDYKERLPEDRIGLVKLVTDIVAMHNTYGGYLVVGVREVTRDKEFEYAGVDNEELPLSRLRDLLREFTGVRIEIHCRRLSAPAWSNSGIAPSIDVLYIPKRVEKSSPVAFRKKGPHDSDNRPIFQEEAVFYRNSDQTLQASVRIGYELHGDRPSPYESRQIAIGGFSHHIPRISHNLPDRNFICADLVGRRDLLDSLWNWLHDDFSRVKVLCGEGGLGKTSIAYHFAVELCSTPGVNFEQVVWLTAKKRQFVGIDNSYREVPETHFSTYDELLRLLCDAMAALPIADDELTEKHLKRTLQESANVVPTLFVIDDVDSLAVDEQRKTFELGFVFAGTQSRMLLTTRINQSFSTTVATQITGLSASAFSEYLGYVQERLKLRSLTDREKSLFFDASGGSPLFGESLYRLTKLHPPAQAAREWKGHRGDEVRAAAYAREVAQLSQEAKRVLVAASYMQTASITELSEVTGYPSMVLEDCIQELASLYLVSDLQITDEPRFRVETNTQKHVLAGADALVPDSQSLVSKIREIRSRQNQGRGDRGNKRVGAAINQSFAQVKAGKIEDAIATIDAAERSIKNHPDLLATRARLLLKTDPPRTTEAARAARQAFENGSRKEVMFLCWFDAELSAGHPNGAALVASHVLKLGAFDRQEWLSRRALAKTRVALDHERLSQIESAISELWAADRDLATAEKLASSEIKRAIVGDRCANHDLVWRLSLDVLGRDVSAARLAVDEVFRMIAAGDTRLINLQRMIEVLNWINVEMQRREFARAEIARDGLPLFQRVRREVDAIIAKKHPDLPRLAIVKDALKSAEEEFANLSVRTVR